MGSQKDCDDKTYLNIKSWTGSKCMTDIGEDGRGWWRIQIEQTSTSWILQTENNDNKTDIKVYFTFDDKTDVTNFYGNILRNKNKPV